ncbi:hypothetical protein [Listeria grayi]|nr:hypothetical protein [Listeria grayi]
MIRVFITLALTVVMFVGEHTSQMLPTQSYMVRKTRFNKLTQY